MKIIKAIGTALVCVLVVMVQIESTAGGEGFYSTLEPYLFRPEKSPWEASEYWKACISRPEDSDIETGHIASKTGIKSWSSPLNPYKGYVGRAYSFNLQPAVKPLSYSTFQTVQENPPNEVSEYDETRLRRFEIVFLISMPVSFVFSLAGLGVFRALSGRGGGFGPMDYTYLLASSVGISLSIALHDYKEVFKTPIGSLP